MMKITGKNYKIKKILNNSSLIVNDHFHEVVLIGKGMAFGLRSDGILPKGTRYEQKYQSSNGVNQFSTLISGYSDLTIQLVMDTIQLIVSLDTSEFKNNDLLSISDHLAAAFTRIQNGEAIKSFFSFETKALYPESYEKALRIAAVINERYTFVIPEAEISYIALHIQNLNSDAAKRNVELLAAIIDDVYELLAIQYQVNVQENNNYLRFLTHLRFLIEGTLNYKTALDQEVNDLLMRTYPNHAIVARKIIEIVESHLHVLLSQKEVYYILIHLVNVSQVI